MGCMRLTHFALALTIILLCITSYLAWQGQEEIKGLKREHEFEKKQLQADQAASPSPASMIPLPSAPETKGITPPQPGTIAASPVPAPAPAPSPAGAEDGLPGAISLPGGGLTIPKAVADAEAQGIRTNTLTPIQQQVQAASALGKIKTVVREQGFVVLDIGTKAGLKPGQKLEIRRNQSILARVTVTGTIEENEAVADLDFASIPTGVTLEPGDEIIAPVSR